MIVVAAVLLAVAILLTIASLSDITVVLVFTRPSSLSQPSHS